MEGFFALARKEMLGQRRTWRFLGTAGALTAVGLLSMFIPLIVALVRGHERTGDDKPRRQRSLASRDSQLGRHSSTRGGCLGRVPQAGVIAAGKQR